MTGGTENTRSVIQYMTDERNLWDGRYKIPWDDPDFSRRMLREHLSQEHDLASRKADTIEAQVEWIHRNIGRSSPGRLLDIGCGPGLYIERLAALGYDCVGLDFSPASIEYARSRLGEAARLIQGDVRRTDFGHGFDAAMMLFGEINVFSPEECRNLLDKAFQALKPGGTLLLEVHAFEAVRRAGEAPASWHRSGPGLQGLFSDEPHLCLMEKRWFSTEQTAQTVFHIIMAGDRAESYRSTTRAWTNDEYIGLLSGAGFRQAAERPDWPVNSPDFLLFSAVKP